MTEDRAAAANERVCRWALFRDGLGAQKPEGGLALRVQDLLNAGIGSDELVRDLDAFRESVSESDEDIVLSVMDRLVGWCSPFAELRRRSDGN